MAETCLQRVGLGYELSADGVTLSISRLRDTRDGLGGELRAMVGTETAFIGRFNVGSLASRSSTAKYVRERLAASAEHQVDWGALLERFSQLVLEEHRRGHPFELVGGPVKEGEDDGLSMLMRPLLWDRAPTLAFAKGGTGKSLFAALVAVSAQLGREILIGFKPEQGVSVLLLDWEDESREWTWQIRAVSKGAHIEPPYIHYQRMTGALADQVEELAAFIAEHEIRLVIVDSVSGACGSGHDSENPNARANRLFDALRLLNVSALLLDHVAGADLEREGVTPKPIDGVMKVNRARAMYELRAEREPVGDRIELVLIDAKRNRRQAQPPLGFVAEFEDLDDAGRARCIHFARSDIDDDQLAATALNKAERMRRFLLQSGAQHTRIIARELGSSESYIRNILSRDKAGIFRRLDNGLVGVASRG